MSLSTAVLICAIVSVVFGLLLVHFGYKYRTIEDESDYDDLDDEPDQMTPKEAAAAAVRHSELLAQRTREIREDEDRRRKPQFP